MWLFRRNVKALPSGELEFLPIEFHYRLPRKDVEELLSDAVRVTFLGLAGWNPFTNHAQVGRLQKMPAIAVIAPEVMLSI